MSSFCLVSSSSFATKAHLFFLLSLSLSLVSFISQQQDPTAAAVAASDAATKMASSSGAAAPVAPEGGPASLAADLKARHASLRASRAAAAPDANEVFDAVANAMDAASAAAGAR